MRPIVKRLLLLGQVDEVLGGGGWAPSFLLRDDFTTAAAAPLTTPRTAEPGPGTLTLVQTDGQLSIASGKLVFPAQSTPVSGDQGAYGAGSFARTVGRTVVGIYNFSAFGDWGTLCGWLTSAALGANSTNIDNAIKNIGAGVGRSAVGSEFSSALGSNFATATDYKCAVALRSTGAFLFLKGGAYTQWTLLWASVQGTTATLYPHAHNNKADAGTLDLFRVLDLPAPFNSDYGLATQRVAGTVSVGQTFTHEANCVLEFVQTTLPSASTVRFHFRQQDASNYWRVTVGSTGTFNLDEVVATVITNRATSSNIVANGHRVVVVCDGTTIRGYSNNVLRWTYSSAATFATNTAGELNLLGTGGAVSDIVSWPRTLPSAAAALLDLAVA